MPTKGTAARLSSRENASPGYRVHPVNRNRNFNWNQRANKHLSGRLKRRMCINGRTGRGKWIRRKAVERPNAVADSAFCYTMRGCHPHFVPLTKVAANVNSALGLRRQVWMLSCSTIEHRCALPHTGYPAHRVQGRCTEPSTRARD
jgi:hypothetical protein